MELKSFATSTNAFLAQKSGNSTTPIQKGQLAVVLYTNNVVVFDIAGSSFELLPGAKIMYESEKEYKRCYHFVSDPISGTVLVLKVNENYESIDNIFKQGIQLVPIGSSSMILNSSSFKSIGKSDPSKYPSMKFTESKMIGGTINPNSKTQPSITPLQTKNSSNSNGGTETQGVSGNVLGAIPKGVGILGQGVNTVGKTVGQTATSLLGGVVGGLTNIGQGVYNGVKNGITQ